MSNSIKGQLHLFSDTSKTLPGDSPEGDKTDQADIEKQRQQLIQEGKKISAYWAKRPISNRIINWTKAVQMAFNFDLKIILDMKRIAIESKNTLSALISKTSFKSASYADALKIVFSVYRQWKKKAVFNMDDIPAFVFIQE